MASTMLSGARPETRIEGRPARAGVTPAPDISVVIATCNRPHTLVHAVDSALMQAGPAIEVIVVDDSAERTAQKTVAAVADDRVRYLSMLTPSRGRPAVARNLGLSQARGAFVHFLDDDDLVPDGFYAAATGAFAASPRIASVFGVIAPFGLDADAVAAESRYFDQARQRAKRCARLGKRWAFTAAMLFGSTLLVCSAGLVRRGAAEAVGGFDPTLPVCEDVDFHLRAIRHGGVRFLDRPALRYRVHPSLMRQVHCDDLVIEGTRRMRNRYCQEHGTMEFTALRLLGKVIGVS